MSDILSLRLSGSTALSGEAYGIQDSTQPGMVMQIGVAGSTAIGPLPHQTQKTFSSEVLNPTAADILLYTVSTGKTFLLTDFIVTGTPSAAVLTRLKARSTLTSGAIAFPAAPTLGSTPGGAIAATTYYAKLVARLPNNGGSAAGGTEASFAVALSNLLTVTAPALGSYPAGTVFDVYASTSTNTETLQFSGLAPGATWTEPTTGLVAGAAYPTTSSLAVTFANPDTTPSWAPTSNPAPYGDLFFVGQTVYIEDPSSAQYEAVVVSAVQRANGIVTGFTAPFTKTHAANAIVAVPLSVGHVNSTKGIELIGIETQPHAPAGWTIAMAFGAQTATFAYNVGAFEQ